MNKYKEEFEKNWNEGCGLVAPSYVAKMLNLKGGAATIIPLWEKKGRKIYRSPQDPKKPLLAWKDYLEEKKEREIN